MADYSKDPLKINLTNNSNDQSKILTWSLYSHDILKDVKKDEIIKITFKMTVKFFTTFIKSILDNMNEENLVFAEKFLLVLFYWLSLNYDVYSILIDEDSQNKLKFLNYVLQTSSQFIEIKSKEEEFQQFKEKINNKIMPVESLFYGFIPLNRFFVLNPKSNIFKTDDINEYSLINKITLIHFFNLFNLSPENVKFN